MKLIHFTGLNCYHDCVITLANAFGLDYTAAFSHLWAEGAFRYDSICGVFLTRRLMTALEAMGMKLLPPCVTEEEKRTGWEKTPNGAFAIIGMDAYRIPWNPLYQLQYGPHYFIAQKGEPGLQTCFDPTYGLEELVLSDVELCSNSYAFIPVCVTHPFAALEGGDGSLLAQAQEVLENHTKTLEEFLEQATVWIHTAGETALLPAKYTDAFLTGRYLYRYYLEERETEPQRAHLFWNKRYIGEWQAVKNGFYKAALTQPDNVAFDEACRRIAALFEQETALSKQILWNEHEQGAGNNVQFGN